MGATKLRLVASLRDATKMKPAVRSKFLKVACPGCGQEQVVFDSASTVVKCLQCEATLAEPSGGKTRLADNAKVIETL